MSPFGALSFLLLLWGGGRACGGVGGMGGGYLGLFFWPFECESFENLLYLFLAVFVHIGSSAGKHEVDGDDVVSLLDVMVPFLLDHLADTDGPHHSSPRPPLLFQRRHHNLQRWNCHFLPVLLLLSGSGCLLPHGQHFHRQRCDCVGSLSLRGFFLLLLLLT